MTEEERQNYFVEYYQKNKDKYMSTYAKRKERMQEYDDNIKKAIDAGEPLFECIDCKKMLPEFTFRAFATKGNSIRTYRCKRCQISMREETKRANRTLTIERPVQKKRLKQTQYSIEYLNQVAWHFEISYGYLVAFPDKMQKYIDEYEEWKRGANQ